MYPLNFHSMSLCAFTLYGVYPQKANFKAQELELFTQAVLPRVLFVVSLCAVFVHVTEGTGGVQGDQLHPVVPRLPSGHLPF